MFPMAPQHSSTISCTPLLMKVKWNNFIRYLSEYSLFYFKFSGKFSVSISFQTTIISLTSNFIASIDCMDCGFFSKKQAGSEISYQLSLDFGIKFFVTVYGSIYSRIPYPSCEDVEENLKILSSCEIPRKAWFDVRHDNCFEVCKHPSLSKKSSFVTSSSSYRHHESFPSGDYDDHHGLH